MGTPDPRFVEPSPDAATWVRDTIRADGLDGVARTIGIDREALLRVAASLPVRRGTLAIVREAMRDMGAEGEQP